MAEAPPGFWSYLNQRIIVISTMERDVRTAFIAGSAMVVLAVALNLLGDRLGPSVNILVGSVPLGVVAALAFGEFAVFFLISLALLQLKGRWRYLAHGLLLVAFGLFVAANEGDALSFALLVPMAMLWTFSVLGARQAWIGRDYMLGALSTSLAAMLIFVLYVATGRQVLIISALAWQGLIAMLGLCVAATDIAELIVVAVESTTGRLARLAGAPVALVIALLGIAGVIALTLMSPGANVPPKAIAPLLAGATGLSLWLGLIYWMLISRRRKIGSVHLHLDYWALLLIVGVYLVALQAGIALRVLSDPATYRASELFSYPQVFIYTTLVALTFIAVFLIVGRRSERLLVRLAYAVTVGMFIFHYYASRGANIVRIVDAVAIGSLLFLGLSRLSRKMRKNYASVCWIVADLNIAFLAYFAVAILFLSMGGHGHAESLSVGQALIVLIALAWDLISSGQTVTNRHSEAFPRLARVALFVSYVMSVALLVMVATTGKFVSPASGEAVESVFNSEVLVGVGLIMFGAPFIFTMAMLRFRNVLAAADAPAAGEAKTAAESAPVPSHEASMDAPAAGQTT